MAGGVRIFRNKPFSRFARKAGITAPELWDAIERAECGLVDADLGGGVVKQRIARAGSGKSGGFRTIILLRIGSRAFFVHGFAKNDLGNIRSDELAAFKLLANYVLALSERELEAALRAGVFCGDH
ncbi:type II toxin-antitoxin system RelE/ParE family toxin [Niveispirillum sp. KHB5.9]|uniref:type II toxin-antitoxin system RelE/ParE family toxin n=1 Tax=Niveispirillum sp. KHB5.9 TaxID=3400269 RepID=UPI003A836FD6